MDNLILQGVSERYCSIGIRVRVIRTSIANHLPTINKGVVHIIEWGYALRESVICYENRSESTQKNYFNFWPDGGFTSQRPRA